MPRTDSAIRINPSILDRLVDNEPEASLESASGRMQTVGDAKRSVARDLEALLNTRQETLHELSPEYAMVGKSLLVYGLPDFTSCNPRMPNDRNLILRSLEQAITNFEPRLTGLRVSMEPPREHDQALRFRVEAVLSVDPIEEPVTFDTVLQLTTQVYVVQGQDA